MNIKQETLNDHRYEQTNVLNNIVLPTLAGIVSNIFDLIGTVNFTLNRLEHCVWIYIVSNFKLLA